VAAPLVEGDHEAAGAIDRLEAFASFHGPDFYGLPRNRERITLTYVAERSGIARCVMHRWRCRSNPSIALMQAALNTIGFELVICPRKGG
jgi:dihydroorotase